MANSCFLRVATNFGIFDDQTFQFGTGREYLFGAKGMAAPGANSLYYGRGDRFELREIGLDGRLIRLIRLDVPPQPVTAADKDAFLTVLRERARNAGQPGLIDQLYDLNESASHFPAHSEIVVDSERHVWVQDYQLPTARAPRTWYVFDPEGVYSGAVITPAGFQVHQIAGDRVIGRWTDELDVEFVHVYQIADRHGPRR